MPEHVTGRPRVLFLGMRNELSKATFESFSAAGADIVAVLLAADGETEVESSQSIRQLYPEESSSQLRILTPYLQRDLRHAAWEQSIPVFEVRRIADAATTEMLQRLRFDVACVSCFPKRIPGPLLSFPSFGFLNLHPSLLPDYRGPAPLFWVFRNGDQANTGITVHHMDEGLDTGDILLQESISFPDGISGSEADRLCGQGGGFLLAKAVDSMATGSLRPRPQQGEGSYFPSPAISDFELCTSWSARRAYNFMRGTFEWGRPYPLDIGGRHLRLTQACSYAPEETLAHPVVHEGNTLRIQFSPGVLVARTETGSTHQDS